MITLYTFGPKFGTPDPSPFCMKAIALLQMAGLDYELAECDPRKAPKGKGPWMDDNGTVVPDSTFIRWHLESEHGADFDAGLSDEEKSISWAFEKLCEDHLYWAMVYERWEIDENFAKGPVQFFEAIPAPLRPLIQRVARNATRKNLHGHGMGRHSYPEIQRLATRDLEAISTFLADKPYLMGEEPCAADAFLSGCLIGILGDFFQTPIHHVAREHANLVAYRDRTLARWHAT